MLPTLSFQGEIRGGHILQKLEILELRVFSACASVYSLSLEHNCLHPGMSSQEEVLVKFPEQGAATQHRQYLPSTHTHGTALHLALPVVQIFRLYSLSMKLEIGSFSFILLKKNLCIFLLYLLPQNRNSQGRAKPSS